jgi:hypothetical protein
MARLRRRTSALTTALIALTWLTGVASGQRDKLVQSGAVPAPTSSAEFGKLLDDELARWGRVVREKNIKEDRERAPSRRRAGKGASLGAQPWAKSAQTSLRSLRKLDRNADKFTQSAQA